METYFDNLLGTTLVVTMFNILYWIYLFVSGRRDMVATFIFKVLLISLNILSVLVIIMLLVFKL